MYDVKGLPSIVMSTRLADSLTVSSTWLGDAMNAERPTAEQRKMTQRIGCSTFTLAVKFYHMSTHFKVAIGTVITTVAIAVTLAPVSAQKPAAEGKRKNTVEPKRVEKGGWI